VVLPAPVLDAAHQLVGGIQALLRRLHLLCHRMPTERLVGREEELTLVIEALARVEVAVRRSVAVGPVVIAGREHRRALERVEPAECSLVKGVIARTAGSLLQVAVVYREHELLLVHIVDQPWDQRLLLIAIWQVTPQADGVLKRLLV
jgi:hypothetical protein